MFVKRFCRGVLFAALRIGHPFFGVIIMAMIELFPDLPIISHKQKETIANLEAGEIDDLRVSNQLPIDDIVKFGLKVGFNTKNKYERTAPFHGETLKHVLLSTKADKLLDWFNNDWNQLMKSNAPGRTRQYIIDGTEIIVPRHLYESFEGAGLVKNKEGEISCEYKVIWIQEIIDRKGVIRSMKFAPIQTHALLLMDRGFLDGEWITHLKIDRKIDICMPLRSNSDS